jgi:hypothetical protein
MSEARIARLFGLALATVFTSVLLLNAIATAGVTAGG